MPNSLYQRLALLLMIVAILLAGLAFGRHQPSLGAALIVLTLLLWHCRRLDMMLMIVTSQRDAVKERMDALLQRIAQAKALAQDKTGPRVLTLEEATGQPPRPSGIIH